jgi:hypothetical protein
MASGVGDGGAAPWQFPPMTTFLIILVAAAMLATLGVLLAGVFGLARGSDPMRSNVLMRWRVVLQGVALLLFLLLMWMVGN